MPHKPKPANCVNCGSRYMRDRPSGKCCSYRCSALLRERNRPDKAPIYDKQCECCGVLFKHKRLERKFCSRKCFDALMGGAIPAIDTGRTNVPRWNRKDLNHGEIVGALEKIGCSVIDASGLGGGVPDLIVGFQGKWFVIEVKNKENDYGRRGLNKNQKAWVGRQRAPVYVVYTSEEAINIVTDFGKNTFDNPS